MALPAQGWKIHISACPHNADDLLSTVWNHCVTDGVHFKFLTTPDSLRALNSKYAPRRSAGKFITVYPVDLPACRRALVRLAELLRGEPGPEVYTDLRWADSPVHCRYGGFQARYCRQDGRLVRAIEAPDGRLVPDDDGTGFRVPGWVELPDFLVPHLRAREDAGWDGVPYRLERVLHLFNGGGVYLARVPGSGRPVVLKEARPHAGLDADGSDAATRQRREWDALVACRGLDAVPAVHELLRRGGRGLLVQDHVEGVALDVAVARRHPLVRHDAAPAERARYAAWARRVVERVEAAVAALHDRGVVFGDLHPGNVIAGAGDRVTLVDFESAFRVGEPRRPGLGYPGFAPPPGVGGVDVDAYALAALRLSMFLPLTCLVPFDPAKPAELAAAAAELFDVPAAYFEPAVRVLTAARPRAVADVPRAVAAEPQGMARAVLASATPERRDRLFPGDVAQFHVGGLGLAYGAAGVLYALNAAGCAPGPDHARWLVRAMRRERAPRPGFYDGLHGMAYALADLGHLDDALWALDRAAHLPRAQLGTDLFAGLAGIGLARLHFADLTGDPAHRQVALDVAEVVAGALNADNRRRAGHDGAPPPAGLLRGACGPALFFVRLFEATGDREFLQLAAGALRRDLAQCDPDDDGCRHVRRGHSLLSHLSTGGAGVACVLDAYLAHRPDEELAAAGRALRRATEAPFYVQPGLFNGRAGVILYRSGRCAGRPAVDHDPVVARHLRWLRWHSLSYRGHPAFPGDQLLRLSMDLATGTAGVLLAVAAATTDDRIHLPFLAPTRTLCGPGRTARDPTTRSE